MTTTTTTRAHRTPAGACDVTWDFTADEWRAATDYADKTQGASSTEARSGCMMASCAMSCAPPC